MLADLFFSEEPEEGEGRKQGKGKGALKGTKKAAEEALAEEGKKRESLYKGQGEYSLTPGRLASARESMLPLISRRSSSKQTP